MRVDIIPEEPEAEGSQPCRSQLRSLCPELTLDNTWGGSLRLGMELKQDGVLWQADVDQQRSEVVCPLYVSGLVTWHFLGILNP